MIIKNLSLYQLSQLLGEDRFQDIEKIKTIGSTYMAVSGLSPEKQVRSPHISSGGLVVVFNLHAAPVECEHEALDNCVVFNILQNIDLGSWFLKEPQVESNPTEKKYMLFFFTLTVRLQQPYCRGIWTNSVILN